MSSLKNPSTQLILIGATFVALFHLVWGFTEPTQTPPLNNVAPPLDTSTTGQIKAGGLLLNSSGAPNGLIIQLGNVGIGTTTPVQTLGIQGNALISGTSTSGSISATSTLSIGPSGSRLNVRESGNVGIGTTSPSYTLGVGGDVIWSGILQGGSVPWARLTSYPASCPIGQFVTSIGLTLNCASPASVSGPWVTSGNDIYSSNTGNVGIGTPTPRQKLEVTGGIVTPIIYDSDSYPPGYYMDPGGVSRMNYPQVDNLFVYGASYVGGWSTLNYISEPGGIPVYLCPLSSVSNFCGPGGENGCVGQLSLYSVCYQICGGGGWNVSCQYVGHLVY